MLLTVAAGEPPDDARLTLPAAAGNVRREILRQYGEGGSLAPDRPVALDGVPARRITGSGAGRAVDLVVAVHLGRSWTLTLAGPQEGFSSRALDEALRSWRWDR